MAKSSIHIIPVKAGSEKHNNREKKLDYVREDLSHLNTSFNDQSIADTRTFAEKNCKEKTGRAMQATATPIREGVLLISENHSTEDLKRLAEKLEHRFGIKTIQGYCHKDEGHFDKESKEWKPNYHAHMVFDWQDHSTGKSIKLNRDDMAELQTIVAEELHLERGVSSSKEHLNALQYKNQEEEKDLIRLNKLKNGLVEAQNIVRDVEPLRKDVKSLGVAKKDLQDETSLMRSNIAYLIEKEEQRKEEIRQAERKLAELQERIIQNEQNLKKIQEQTHEIKQHRGMSR